MSDKHDFLFTFARSDAPDTSLSLTGDAGVFHLVTPDGSVSEFTMPDRQVQDLWSEVLGVFHLYEKQNQNFSVPGWLWSLECRTDTFSLSQNGLIPYTEDLSRLQTIFDPVSPYL